MKAIRVLFKILFTTLMAIFVFWMALFLVLQSERGQEWALSRLINYLKPNSDTEVHIRRVEFALPLGLRLHDFALIQHQTLLVSVKDLECSCALPSLMNGRLVFASMHANQVHIAKNALDLFQSAPEGAPIDWNSPFPIDFKVKNLLVENVQIDPALIDIWVKEKPQLAEMLKQSTFQLQGFINNNLQKHAFSAHLLASAIPDHEVLNLSIQGEI